MNYWTSRSRTSRRRFLQGAGATVAGSASLALVGCGGDSDEDDVSGLQGLATPTPGANPTAAPKDPFAGAKRGGTFRMTQVGDAPTIDPYGNFSYLGKMPATFAYSRLFMYKAGPGIKPADVRPTGDLVETFETSADGLKWTMKLRPNLKFHDVAPVNGRTLTTDDVKFSWGRATDLKNTNAAQFNTVVDKVEFPDASTIVFSLKAPSAAFTDLLADASLLHIQPVEADGRFNPAQQMIGTGPWIMTSYQPTVGWKFRKNPTWWNTGFPLMDEVVLSVVPEYANRIAQFQAGNTDQEGPNAETLIALRKGIKDLQVFGALSTSQSWIYLDPDPASPWNKDERIRLAISMSIDRDALTDLAYEVNKLRAAGLDHPINYNSVIPAGHTRFWLDPKSAAQGESAKNFQYNVAEAKKLMSAAGFADGFSSTYQYTRVYGATFDTLSEANIPYLNAIGIKTTTEVQDYPSKYSTKTFVGDFKGIAFGPESAFPEAGGIPLRLFSENSFNHSRIKDPTLAKLAQDQARELNEAKRKEIMAEIQRENAKHMWYIPHQGGAGIGWVVYQPNMRNALDYRTTGYGFGTETIPYYWKDA